MTGIILALLVILIVASVLAGNGVARGRTAAAVREARIDDYFERRARRMRNGEW